jgi:murein hydrolase activator
VPRPDRPETAVVAVDAPPPPAPPAGLPVYVLPASGRLVAGFVESPPGLPRSRGIVLAVRQGAQAVAPAPGRVAFAGPYRGYGSIVIIDHEGGWTSLITGLAQLDTRIGQSLVAGSPLGIAGAGQPLMTLELRRNGEPVNPLDYIRTL